MAKRTSIKLLFSLLVVAGVAAVAVALAVPVTLPALIPLGCIFFAGAFSMYQSALVEKQNEIKVKKEAAERSISTERVAPNITMNFMFGYGKVRSAPEVISSPPKTKHRRIYRM